MIYFKAKPLLFKIEMVKGYAGGKIMCMFDPSITKCFGKRLDIKT